MKADLETLKATPEDAIDTSDPDAPDRSGEGGWVRAIHYRPRKQPVSIRIDMDVLDWFKEQGRPYQSLMNRVLRSYMEDNANNKR